MFLLPLCSHFFWEGQWHFIVFLLFHHISSLILTIFSIHIFISFLFYLWLKNKTYTFLALKVKIHSKEMNLGRWFFLYNNKQRENLNRTIFCPYIMTHGPKIFIASVLYILIQMFLWIQLPWWIKTIL